MCRITVRVWVHRSKPAAVKPIVVGVRLGDARISFDEFASMAFHRASLIGDHTFEHNPRDFAALVQRLVISRSAYSFG